MVPHVNNPPHVPQAQINIQFQTNLTKTIKKIMAVFCTIVAAAPWIGFAASGHPVALLSAIFFTFASIVLLGKNRSPYYQAMHAYMPPPAPAYVPPMPPQVVIHRDVPVPMPV